MAYDGRRTRHDAVDLADPGDQSFQGVDLGRRGDFLFKIARHIDADGMVVLPFGMSTDRSQRAAPFNGPVFADDVMVTDTGPAVGQMGAMDSRCRRIAIGDADVMDDDHVRLRPQEQRFAELEIRFLDGHRFGRRRIGHGIIVTHDAAGSGGFRRPRDIADDCGLGGCAGCSGWLGRYRRRLAGLVFFTFPAFLAALAALALALATASMCWSTLATPVV